MNSVPGAADDSLLEEMRTGNLERECNEETCDWAEAFEIFGDKAQTDDFMYNRLHPEKTISLETMRGAQKEDKRAPSSADR